MSARYSIRQLQPSDHPKIVEAIPSWWGGRDLAYMVPKLFADHFHNTSFVVEAEEGHFIGFLVGFLSQSHPSDAYIHFVGTHPDYRKLGIGQALYSRFFALCQASNRTRVRCCTSPVNRGSIEFHKRMGFQITPGTGEIDGIPVTLDHNKPGDPKVQFVKELPVVDPARSVLMGQCVRIEPLKEKHLPGLEKNFDPTLFKYYPRTDYRSAQEFCDENWACEKSGTFEPYVIIDQTSGEAIGCVEYSGIDQKNRKLEIGGSWLGRKFQGGPWNTEAKLLLLSEAFEKRGFIRVQFTTDSLNLQSQAALEKIGAKREGVLRNHSIQPDGRIRHNVYFSVVSEEWPRTKEHLIARLQAKTQGL